MIEDFVLVERQDPTRIDFLSVCCFGLLAPGVPQQVLEVRKNTDVEHLDIELENIFISGFSPEGMTAGGSAEIPEEELTLSFDKVEFTFTPSTGGEPMQLVDFGATDTWQVIPEPSTAALVALGAVALFAYGRRSRRWHRR